jgi:glycerophosphoryl diester phosphodiesterase
MVLYALCILAVVFALLAPGTSWVLHKLATFGDVIVGNYTVHLWLLTPQGFLYLILAGSVIFFGANLLFTGLLEIADTEVGQSRSARDTLLVLLRDAPSLLRFSAAMYLLHLPAALSMAVGPGLAFLLLLTGHDINYYLTQHPPEWYLMLALSGIWLLASGLILLRFHIRLLYVLPLWTRHRILLRKAVPRSWELSKGRFIFLFRQWLKVMAAAGLLFFVGEGALYLLTKWILIRFGGSLDGVIQIMSAYLVISTLYDVLLAVFLACWGICILLLCYRQDSGEVEPSPILPTSSILGWRQARRLLRLLMAAAAVSLGVSWWIARQPVQTDLPLVIAHRAGAAAAPENTLAAMERVIKEEKTDWVEIDVAPTLDGKLLVAHDADFMKVAGDPRMIRETAYADLAELDIGSWFDPKFHGERPQLLHEFLAQAKDNLTVIVEFKHGKETDLVERVIQQVRTLEMEDQVVLMSLELEEVRAVQALAPDIRVGYFASVEMGDLTALNVYCIGAKDGMVTKKFLEEVHEQGMKVFSWTVDDPARIIELTEMGVDGIITNDPEMARSFLDRVDKLPPAGRLLLRYRQFWMVLKDMGWFS